MLYALLPINTVGVFSARRALLPKREKRQDLEVAARLSLRMVLAGSPRPAPHELDPLRVANQTQCRLPGKRAQGFMRKASARLGQPLTPGVKGWASDCITYSEPIATRTPRSIDAASRCRHGLHGVDIARTGERTWPRQRLAPGNSICSTHLRITSCVFGRRALGKQ